MWWFYNSSNLKSPQDEFASSNLVLHTFDTNGLASHQKKKKDKKRKTLSENQEEMHLKKSPGLN